MTIFFCVARKRREDDAATPLLPACRPSRLPSRPVSACKTRRNPGSVTPLDGLLPTAEIRAAVPALSRNAASLVERAEREPMTLRQAAGIMARSRVHQSFTGTPVVSFWLISVANLRL